MTLDDEVILALKTEPEFIEDLRIEYARLTEICNEIYNEEDDD